MVAWVIFSSWFQVNAPPRPAVLPVAMVSAPAPASASASLRAPAFSPCVSETVRSVTPSASVLMSSVEAAVPATDTLDRSATVARVVSLTRLIDTAAEMPMPDLPCSPLSFTLVFEPSPPGLPSVLSSPLPGSEPATVNAPCVAPVAAFRKMFPAAVSAPPDPVSSGRLPINARVVRSRSLIATEKPMPMLPDRATPPATLIDMLSSTACSTTSRALTVVPDAICAIVCRSLSISENAPWTDTLPALPAASAMVT